jgi:hypothetical protein
MSVEGQVADVRARADVARSAGRQGLRRARQRFEGGPKGGPSAVGVAVADGGPTGQSGAVRLTRFLIVVCLLAAACSGEEPGAAGVFNLDGEEFEGDWPPGPPLSADWTEVAAVVVQAPAVVTAGEEVDVVVELRSQAKDALSLDPCPTWVGWVLGENSSLAPTLTGHLPCDQLDHIEPEQRVRLGITLPAPSDVDCHDGYDPDFVWKLLDGQEHVIEARVNIPMREKDSAAPNDCGGRAGTTAPPPDLERT